MQPQNKRKRSAEGKLVFYSKEKISYLLLFIAVEDPHRRESLSVFIIGLKNQTEFNSVSPFFCYCLFLVGWPAELNWLMYLPGVEPGWGYEPF